ncbi:MAG: ASCH domain-containing protein [Pseudomonadota bacterium]
MQFLKRLRDPIREGKITSSVRIWQSPRVKVGGRYPLAPGFIHVTSIRQINLENVTPAMAKASGFEGTVDLLRTAKHGSGRNVYFIEFEYSKE